MNIHMSNYFYCFSAKTVTVDMSAHFAVREEKEKKDDSNGDQTKEMMNLPLAFPYLLMLSGCIMLLLVLAILGLCFQPSK